MINRMFGQFFENAEPDDRREMNEFTAYESGQQRSKQPYKAGVRGQQAGHFDSTGKKKVLKGQDEFYDNSGKSMASPRIEGVLHARKSQMNKAGGHRLSPSGHGSSIALKAAKQTHTSKNSHVARIELMPSPSGSPLKYGLAQGYDSQKQKGTMIQKLPPSVVLNSKQESKVQPSFSGHATPASGGSFLQLQGRAHGANMGTRSQYKAPQAISPGQSTPSNSNHRKNQISKPIVPPHLKLLAASDVARVGESISALKGHAGLQATPPSEYQLRGGYSTAQMPAPEAVDQRNYASISAAVSPGGSYYSHHKKQKNLYAPQYKEPSLADSVQMKKSQKAQQNANYLGAKAGKSIKNTQSLHQSTYGDFSNIDPIALGRDLGKTTSKLSHAKAGLGTLLPDDSASKLSKLPYSSTQSQNSFLKNSYKSNLIQSTKYPKYQTLTSKAASRIQKQKQKTESLRVSIEPLEKPYNTPGDKGANPNKQPPFGMQAQLHSHTLLPKDEQGRIVLRQKSKMPTTQVHTLKNSMKNSACSSAYGTPAYLSRARNSRDTSTNPLEEQPGPSSAGGPQQAILNINPHLKEKFNKINWASEKDLIRQESEGDLDEEDDGLEQGEDDAKRVLDTMSNKDGAATWANTRKGSINNLPQMTIINLEQMQSKQRHLKWPGAVEHSDASNLQIKLNMSKLTKGKHQSSLRHKDLNAGGAVSSRPSSNTRFHGQGDDPLAEDEAVASDQNLPSSRLVTWNLQSTKELKGEKIVVKANNGSQNIVFSGPNSTSLFTASAMSLRKKKAFVSKTAQVSAQVSAYASKNNSQNSSQARVPVGTAPQKSKQLHHHELGTALRTLKPTSLAGQGGATKGGNRITNSYKTQSSKFHQIHSVQALQVESREALDHLSITNDKSREALSGLGSPHQVTGLKQSQQSQQTTLKPLKAQPEKGVKKKIFKNNQSSLISSVLSTNSSKQILNQTRHKTDAASKIMGNTMKSGGIYTGMAKDTATLLAVGQMTLKSKIKEKVLVERRLTGVDAKANAPRIRAGLAHQDQVSVLTTPIESQNIREDSKYETDRGLAIRNKPLNYPINYSSNLDPEGIRLNQINLIGQDPNASHRSSGYLPSNKPSQPSSARDQPQVDQPSTGAWSHPQSAFASMAKKKHLQPSQGSAQKKNQRARVVGEPIPVASQQPTNAASGRRLKPNRQIGQESQDQDDAEMIGDVHQDHNPFIESRHSNNEIDLYYTPSTNQVFEVSGTIQASAEKQKGAAQYEGAPHYQIGNPTVSLCEPIDELNESESQPDKAQQSGTEPILTFNIGHHLQDQLNQNHKMKAKGSHLSPALNSPRLSTQVRERSSLVNPNTQSRKNRRGDSKISHGSNRMSNNSNLENHSESSQQVQLKEFYRDIQKLRKKIQLHFQEFRTMMESSREFYRIGRVLGRGAFGKVNLACHKVCEHLVAIKSIEKKVLRNEKEQKRRVMQEMSILKQGGHENVVRLYDTFETNKHICFVMELCHGGDLLSYVRKRRKLKEDNAKYLFKQLIEGLNYIHTKKFVVHRDIKLDNILLDQSGRIKICDFGVSRQVKSEKERMHHQCGTPAYIAPEIIKERGYRGFKADMWSAGVCLYVMLIGTVPFRAGTMEELHRLIKEGKYDFEGEILSAQAQDLLKKLIQVNYRKRLSAEDTLKHPWLQTTMDGKEPVDTARSDLADIIFTDKEKQLINKDYLYRLEKIKQKRFRHAKDKEGSNAYKQPQASKNNEYQRLNLPAHTNQASQNSRIITDSDFIFTEHNLDTKEDDVQIASNHNQMKDNKQNMIQDLFKKQQNDEEDPPKGVFTKFEGFDVKPKMAGNRAQQEIQNKSLQKNNSEKSIIFAPFNSSYSDYDEDHPERFEWPADVITQLQPKKSKIMKFSKKCRDLNREYETNNNADLDNGVYNAFVHEQEMEAEAQQMKKQQEMIQQQSDNQNIDQQDMIIFNDPKKILKDFKKGQQPEISAAVNTKEDRHNWFEKGNADLNRIDLDVNQWGKRPRGSDQGDSDDDDMNDMTELSSDEEHALEAVVKNHLDKTDKGRNESQMTETQELSIHESMQKMHELNLEQQDGGPDGDLSRKPEASNQNSLHQIQQALNIDEKTVQQTVDQFQVAPSEPADPLPAPNKDADPFPLAASKHFGSPSRPSAHKLSTTKGMASGKQSLFDTKSSNSKRAKQQRRRVGQPPDTDAADEYQQYGNKKVASQSTVKDGRSTVSQCMKEQLIESLQAQDISYLTAAYYLTMKHQFLSY